MKVETFVICDFAAQYGNKLCITGIFNGFKSPVAPVVIPHCGIVARMRFEPVEEGNHKVRITFVDEDGKQVMPNMDGMVGVQIKDKSRCGVFNLIMNVNRLVFPKFGEYRIDLAVNGTQQASITIYFDKHEGQQSNPAPPTPTPPPARF